MEHHEQSLTFMLQCFFSLDFLLICNDMSDWELCAMCALSVILKEFDILSDPVTLAQEMGTI